MGAVVGAAPRAPSGVAGACCPNTLIDVQKTEVIAARLVTRRTKEGIAVEWFSNIRSSCSENERKKAGRAQHITGSAPANRGEFLELSYGNTGMRRNQVEIVSYIWRQASFKTHQRSSPLLATKWLTDTNIGASGGSRGLSAEQSPDATRPVSATPKRSESNTAGLPVCVPAGHAQDLPAANKAKPRNNGRPLVGQGQPRPA